VRHFEELPGPLERYCDSLLVAAKEFS
jgi:hypothetical protein